MRRREFITLLGGAAVSWSRSTRAQRAVVPVTAAAWPLAAGAQPLGKTYRIGVLETIPPTLNTTNLDAFRRALRELGYVEGQNFVIEYRSVDGRTERFPELAMELVRLNVDLIVTRGTPAALAAKSAAKTTPVVMAAIGEPHVVVTSLARPGGNITGLSSLGLDLHAKRVEVLKETVAAVSRIAALMNMSNPAHTREWNEIETAARSLGMQAQLLDVRRPEDLEPAFDAAIRQRADGLVVGLETLIQANVKPIAELATKYRLPSIYASREFVEAGGLIAYAVSYPDLYRRAAYFVDKILKGAKPGDLPVEQPTKFELVINLKTAKALGLTIPPALLVRADEVIE
jgi:putative ABC transport system substrate-binding protein